MGIFAIILAEPLIDRLGGVVDHAAEIVEQAGGPALAVVGEAAEPVAGLAAQVPTWSRTWLTSLSVPRAAAPPEATKPPPAVRGGAGDD